jgi:hypothetical protein
MYKVGDIVYNKSGHEVRIISTDAAFQQTLSSKICNIIAVVKMPSPAGTTQCIYYFDEQGRFAGNGHIQYDLLPNEPTKEEESLIMDILSMRDSCERDTEEKLLKIIRQLRRK